MEVVKSSTCTFGLSPNQDGECVVTLASFCHGDYMLMRYWYLAVGLLAILPASYKYNAALGNADAKLQQRSFLMCIYASVTFILRAIDPKSYGHILPRAVSNLLSYTCTDALVTVMILSLTYWISIVQGMSPSDATTRLKVFQGGAIAFIWGFDLIATMSTFASKGFGGIGPPVQLYVSAVVLTVISFLFLIYGIQILRRLHMIDKMVLVRRSIAAAYPTSKSFDYKDSDAAAIMAEVPVKKMNKPTWRIYKVLILVETIALASIVGQIYVALTRQTEEWVELECANGHHCHKLRARIQVLHCFQYVCIWIIMWTFRKTDKRNSEPDMASQV